MTKIYNKLCPMNRKAFQDFAFRATTIKEQFSNEIFSCATLSFAKEEFDIPPDLEMNPTEFSIAFVRLANLWTIMHDGMENATTLSSQTSNLLSTLIDK